MGGESLLNVPSTREEWNWWSFNHQQEHIRIIQALRTNTGVVKSVSLTSGGSGYTSIPSIVLNGYGNGAQFYMNIRGGVITELDLESGGYGYRDSTIEIVGGGGSGATATITRSPWVSLMQYQLDPINLDNKEAIIDWLERHQQSHVDMDGVLGLDSIDMQRTNLGDSKQLESFIYSNWQEHNAANISLGI